MERFTKVLKIGKYAMRLFMDDTNGLQHYKWRNIENIAKIHKPDQHFQLPNNIKAKIIPITCHGPGRQFLPQVDNFSAYIYRNCSMVCLNLRFLSKEPTKEKIIEISKKYQIDIKYILHLATIQPRKNLIRLIKALSFLMLVISRKLEWMYRVLDFDLLFLYAGSQAFVRVSIEEGFGLPVLEAQAAGTICG